MASTGVVREQCPYVSPFGWSATGSVFVFDRSPTVSLLLSARERVQNGNMSAISRARSRTVFPRARRNHRRARFRTDPRVRKRPFRSESPNRTQTGMSGVTGQARGGTRFVYFCRLRPQPCQRVLHRPRRITIRPTIT